MWPRTCISSTATGRVKSSAVSTKARRTGIGKLLMQHLYDIAVKNNCSRVEWTTDSDNQEAQLFYAELGISVKESKLFYRIEGDKLTRRANP
jgi:ribosomal protein S18 acetylase RimI-like enzyme